MPRNTLMPIRAISVLGDELGFLDDPVEFGAAADEGDVGGEAQPFGGEAIGRARDSLGDMGAHRVAHVADQRPEQFLLALEISVEGAERDAGPGRDAGDRRFVKAALAELAGRGFEQAPESLAAALGAGGLVRGKIGHRRHRTFTKCALRLRGIAVNRCQPQGRSLTGLETRRSI
jgi:hypothetical protein